MTWELLIQSKRTLPFSIFEIGGGELVVTHCYTNEGTMTLCVKDRQDLSIDPKSDIGSFGYFDNKRDAVSYKFDLMLTELKEFSYVNDIPFNILSLNTYNIYVSIGGHKHSMTVSKDLTNKEIVDYVKDHFGIQGDWDLGLTDDWVIGDGVTLELFRT